MLSRKPLIDVLSVTPFEKDQQLLRGIVSRPNWRLLCASGCQDAWQVLHAKPVTVVITERRLPGRNCWVDLVDEIMAMRHAPPVIVMTRKSDEDRVWRDAIRAGAAAVLTKPFEPDEVRRAISAAWQQSRDAQFLKPRTAMLNPRTMFAGA